VFVTAIPQWRPGDTVLAGAHLTRFRIVAIDSALGAGEVFDALWLVEPI
jgi:hypothetical protein